MRSENTARRLNDGRSLRAISSALADEGYKASSDKPFSAAAVKRILGAEPLKSAALSRHASLETVRRYDDNRADHAGQVAAVVDGLAI